MKKKDNTGLFEDDEVGGGLFGESPPESVPVAKETKKKPVGGVSLFGDSSDLKAAISQKVRLPGNLRVP